MAVFNEIEAAHWARFGRFADFRAALRKGQFPAPDRHLPDGPRWDSASLEKWLRKQAQNRDKHEDDLIERLEK